MAALTDAMKWYNLGGFKAVRTKYHFQVEFYSSQYIAELQPSARLIFDAIKTIELPKYSIETEIINAWNVRQIIPTKVNLEPISITFHDTLDNRFQNFLVNYLNITTGSLQPSTKSLRTSFDSFGVKLLETSKDCPIDKIVMSRFYNANEDRSLMENISRVTLWRPKIIDIQHDA